MFHHWKLYNMLLSIIQPTKPSHCDVLNGGEDGDELIIHPMKGEDDPIPDVFHAPCTKWTIISLLQFCESDTMNWYSL